MQTTANSYNWGLAPIDMADAIAREHDLNQEEIGTFSWLEDVRTLPGDLEAVQAWDQFRAEYGGTGNIDPYTGREASTEALRAARSGSQFFGILARYKQWKIGELERRGLDPTNPEYMRQVTIQDYRGKWYQFKRNSEQKILENASDAPQ